MPTLDRLFVESDVVLMPSRTSQAELSRGAYEAYRARYSVEAMTHAVSEFHRHTVSQGRPM